MAAGSWRTGPSPAGLGQGRRPSLLIADSEADDELLPALRDQGVEVSVVADGALALVEIGRLAPSAVLLTASLPVVDGVTVIRTVRAATDRATTPILFAVGPGDREQAAAALEAGASACVGKPYRVHEVLAMVGAVGGLAGSAPHGPDDLAARPPAALVAGAAASDAGAVARVLTAGPPGSVGLPGTPVNAAGLVGADGTPGASTWPGVPGVAGMGPQNSSAGMGLVPAAGGGPVPGVQGLPAAAALVGERSEILRSGPVVLDVDAHEVTVDGRAVHMPPREFRLLRLLLGHAGRVVTRETLLTEVWGSPDTDPNTLAVHVRRLRRRLGDPAALQATAEPGVGSPTLLGRPGATRGPVEVRPPLIESIRGIGYRFRAPQHPHPS
ncbi:two-component system response regulator [Parafrankia colletiae]|uniref:Two-component system response regulator n=1 Tax=Parafrankia colletiae TaxID=573497 RepID=A0A1S1Q6I3_9ACTN|nr:winged helix-turn-helix domain-containing protein [Parafrankia colletiae]MCK9904054.1 winged helix-turn-helix domain-containing protein [Frankia sp. Cpl3]OHV29206.1 two-component system response regulator [Parafrankia colletiae]